MGIHTTTASHSVSDEEIIEVVRVDDEAVVRRSVSAHIWYVVEVSEY